MITNNLSTLKIHKLTKEQYERELAAGRIEEDAIYLTPDEEVDMSSYVNEVTIDLEGSASDEIPLKPQAPLHHKSGEHFYPLTSVDQVLMEDGSRLNAKLDTLVSDALPKSGGDMSGDINMSGNTLTGLKDPSLFGDAATKGYVDGKRKVFNVTLTAAGWVGTAAPYTQVIILADILSTDTPHYGPVYSKNAQTSLLEKRGWALVDDLDTEDGRITITCFEDKPSVDISVQLEVHR